MPQCPRCQDVGWVCENHTWRPWAKDKPYGCECGVGVPCPDCNAIVDASHRRPRASSSASTTCAESAVHRVDGTGRDSEGDPLSESQSVDQEPFHSGRRVRRPNPVTEWKTHDVPHLRTVDDALWQAVKERQEQWFGRERIRMSSTPLMRRTGPDSCSPDC